MKLAFRTLSVFIVGLLVLCGSLQAKGNSDTSNNDPTCISVSEATVECDGYDSQGRSMYKVHFKFGWVRPGTNFIRIHEGSSQGTTHTYPFQKSKQTVSGKMWWDEYPYRCFTIDVYDVLPNGKVVKCSIEYCLWICCGQQGPIGFTGFAAPPGNCFPVFTDFTKDVVAVEIATPSLTLAPNPATDVVNISIAVPSYDPASSIDIVDMNGNVVATLATGMAAGETVIPADLPNLANGVYMVRMLHADGLVVQQLQIVR